MNNFTLYQTPAVYRPFMGEVLICVYLFSVLIRLNTIIILWWTEIIWWWIRYCCFPTAPQQTLQHVKYPQFEIYFPEYLIPHHLVIFSNQQFSVIKIDLYCEKEMKYLKYQTRIMQLSKVKMLSKYSKWPNSF